MGRRLVVALLMSLTASACSHHEHIMGPTKEITPAEAAQLRAGRECREALQQDKTPLPHACATSTSVGIDH